VNPTANNDLDDTSSLLQSRRSGYKTTAAASVGHRRGPEVLERADPAAT
jgi:hypothetical protein